MKDLIEALTIFMKYGNVPFPTHCEHDILHIMYIHVDDVFDMDIAKLDKLGFFWEDDAECFISHKYGSC